MILDAPPDKLDAVGVAFDTTWAWGIRSAKGRLEAGASPGGNPRGKGGIPAGGGGKFAGGGPAPG